jgi:hypothetical protein
VGPRWVGEGAADAPAELLPLMFGLMMYEGDWDVVAEAISRMPAEARSVIADVAARAFAANSELIHQTPIPHPASEQPRRVEEPASASGACAIQWKAGRPLVRWSSGYTGVRLVPPLVEESHPSYFA